MHTTSFLQCRIKDGTKLLPIMLMVEFSPGLFRIAGMFLRVVAAILSFGRPGFESRHFSSSFCSTTYFFLFLFSSTFFLSSLSPAFLSYSSLFSSLSFFPFFFFPFSSAFLFLLLFTSSLFPDLFLPFLLLYFFFPLFSFLFAPPAFISLFSLYSFFGSLFFSRVFF